MNTPGHSSSRGTQPNINRNSFDVSRLSAWYEDLEEYRHTLQDITNAKLDQTFQDELQHVNQWFTYLNDTEKTATIYTLLQHSSQIQIKFFMHLLQEMRKPTINPFNRASERSSSLMNLNIGQPPSLSVPQQQPPQPPQAQHDRHSFALGDTGRLSRVFGTMGTGWFGDGQIAGQSNSSRPKPEADDTLNPSFSGSWLNKKPLFNENVIKRPRSADISTWPNQPSWQPLTNQHDIHSQQQYSRYDRRASSALTSHALRSPVTESNTVDMDLIRDVPAWLKSMRLHKYNSIFENMRWQDIIKLNDRELESKGVAALGARRKMLKAFDNVKAHCHEHGIKY